MIGEGSRRPCPCDCGTLGFCADRKALTRSRCCEPGCDEPKLEGGGFCREHAERWRNEEEDDA